MYCKVATFTFKGFEPVDIDIEVTISSRGIPRTEITGIGSEHSRQLAKKIKTAMTNSGLFFPNKKIHINVSGKVNNKDVDYMGFPIIMGIYCAHNNTEVPTNGVFYGGVDLSGKLIPSSKTLLLPTDWGSHSCCKIYIPKESHYVNSIRRYNVYEISSLTEIPDIINNKVPQQLESLYQIPRILSKRSLASEAFSGVLGNEQIKRSLITSISGQHNILLLGPSGVGKSILAYACRDIYPEPTKEDLLERMRVLAFCDEDVQKAVFTPFINPHITTSESQLIGSSRMLGDVTLAHKGILFLDEIHLFQSGLLNSLKTVIDTKEVSFNTENRVVTYPADFLLIGAGNNCMCGLSGVEEKQCKCSARDMNVYNSRLNHAFLERFDLQVNVLNLPVEKLFNPNRAGEKYEDISTVREKIKAVRHIQAERLKSYGVSFNSRIPYEHINDVCKLNKDALDLLEMTTIRFRLSPRAVHKIMTVSRTIADLDESRDITVQHIAEAVQYRVKNDKP